MYLEKIRRSPKKNLSPEFIRELPEADKNLFKKFSKYFDYSENNATLPGIFIESKDLIKCLKRLHVFSIDLELSYFYSISRMFGVKAVGILRLTDSPAFEIKISLDEKLKRRKLAGKRILETIFEVLT